METIDQKIHQLPKELQQEIVDFIDFLIAKKIQRKKKKPNLGWIGGLKEYRKKYNALELQKKASEWRD